jgi:hypothetical protein
MARADEGSIKIHRLKTAYSLELLVDGRSECGELLAIFVTILKRSKETS